MTAAEIGGFFGAFIITGLIRYAYKNWYRKHKDSTDPVMPNLLSFVTIILLFGLINTYKYGLVLALFVAVIRYFWAQLCWLGIDCFIEYKKKVQNMTKYILIIGASIICFCCIKIGVVAYVSKTIVPDIINKSVLSCWATAAENFCKDSGYMPNDYIKMLRGFEKINLVERSGFKGAAYAMETSCIRTATEQFYNQMKYTYASKQEICYEIDLTSPFDVKDSLEAASTIITSGARNLMAKEILRH